MCQDKNERIRIIALNEIQDPFPEVNVAAYKWLVIMVGFYL